MQELSVPELISGVALAGGLVAFGRGLLAYRSASRVSSLASSPIVGMAGGEVRVTGTVEAGSTTLISPLQSAPCVYFRSRILGQGDRGGTGGTYFSDERTVQFSVRDDTGVACVFPRGARWELVPRLDEHTGLAGEEPPGLMINMSGAMIATPRDRDAQVAALLTVHDSSTGRPFGGAPAAGSSLSLLGTSGAGTFEDRLSYQEYRVEPGDTVTIVAAAVPFGELPALAAGGDAAEDPLGDPEIAADLEAARAAGLLQAAEDAWGNAAIPGFGIGHPTRAPELDPGATPQPVDPMAGVPDRAGGDPTVTRRPDGAPAVDFQLDPGTLVLASIPEQRMTIYQGSPAEAASRNETAFWLGVGGAALAVVAAAALAIQLAAA